MLKIILLISIISIINCCVPLKSEDVVVPMMSSNEQKTLRFVSILFRHGDRTPEYLIPKDGNNFENVPNWYQGPAELTRKGVKTEYNLGKALHKRYIESGIFIDIQNMTFRPNFANVKASYTNRTIMSAQSVLTGLFPPSKTGDEEVFDKFWQPLPILTRPKPFDTLLRSWSTPCPRRSQLHAQLHRTPAWLKKAKENDILFKDLTKATGMEVNMETIWMVDDTNFVEKQDNVKRLPILVEKDAEIAKLANWTFVQTFVDHGPLSKITGGTMVYDIIQSFERAIREVKDKSWYKEPQIGRVQKMQLYSAHDANIVSILGALQVPDLPCHDQIPYGSYVAVELHEIGDKWEVKVVYNNRTSENAPWCKDNVCEFSNFKKTLEPTTNADYAASCALVDDYQSAPAGFVLFIYFFVVGLSTFGIIWVVSKNKKKNQNMDGLLDGEDRHIN